MRAIEIVPLFGALDAAVQDRAIAPAPKGSRKVVLATSIAETSLTIEGVRIVVDSGLARVPRYEPDIGLTRLETVRASRAAVDQRRGRAGRTEPGVCYRLWDEPQTASLAAYTQPEILSRRSVLAGARSRAMGRQRSRHAGVSRSAAGARAEGSQQPAARTRRARRRRPHHRGRPEPARAGAAAAAGAHDRGFASARRGRGGRRDRRHPDRARARRRQRRSRCTGSISSAATARRARAAPAAWRSAGRRRWRLARTRLAERGRSRLHRHRCSRWPFPIASRATAAMAAFVLANGRGATVEQTSSLARAPYIAVAELTGTAAQRTHPAGRADHAGRDRARISPTRSRTARRDLVRSRRDGAARAPQADAARDHAVGSADRAVALGGDRARLRRRADRRRARQAAVVESR